MAENTPQIGQKLIIELRSISQLLAALKSRGYTTVGPTIRDKAIVYDQIESIEDLPVGWSDIQEGGLYRLMKREDRALFGYVVGPHSWKRFLHQPVLTLFRSHRENGNWTVESQNEHAPKYAFIGVRSCELHAIAIQDRIFLGSEYLDPVYKARREQIFTVAVNCSQPGGTCFCVSMNTGPQANEGYDLLLTEIAEGRHFFILEIGSDNGAEVAGEIETRPATTDELESAEVLMLQSKQRMGRILDTANIKELLYRNDEHPRWENVASRCLSCGNCTMVCPTCFCVTVLDTTDLKGKVAERTRKWDSCFTLDYTYVHGGSVRQSAKARYRHWMTHKLASWHDQFGTSGCVGCGRCITWCPVGIDITEEAALIRKGRVAELEKTTT